MFFNKFRSLQNYQCVALAICLLLLNQQVVGKVESRRRYESAFENLFRGIKDGANQLSSFHIIVQDNKALQQNVDKAMAFVEENHDKIAIGIGLAASSWLLYESIYLASEIERFFNEIEELKGKFNQYYLVNVPKLEELFHKAKEAADYAEPEKQKAYFKAVYEELMKYFLDLQKILDIVYDIIVDVNKGKSDAVINAAVSGTIAALTGVAMVIGGPVSIPSVVWKSGVAATMGMSTVSTTLSLRNAYDLTKASKRLETLKHDLRRLREHVMKKMMEIILYI